MNMFEIPIGQRIERRLFGLLDEEIRAQEPACYQGYYASQEFVKAGTLWKPSWAQTEFLCDLQRNLVEKMRLRDTSCVECYTSLYTNLDRYHGIDAFLVITLGPGKIETVTLDVTAREDKFERRKEYSANIVFLAQYEDMTSRALRSKASGLADEIVAHLLTPQYLRRSIRYARS